MGQSVLLKDELENVIAAIADTMAAGGIYHPAAHIALLGVARACGLTPDLPEPQQFLAAPQVHVLDADWRKLEYNTERVSRRRHEECNGQFGT
jgi:hypothetical protein